MMGNLVPVNDDLERRDEEAGDPGSSARRRVAARPVGRPADSALREGLEPLKRWAIDEVRRRVAIAAWIALALLAVLTVGVWLDTEDAPLRVIAAGLFVIVAPILLLVLRLTRFWPLNIGRRRQDPSGTPGANPSDWTHPKH